MKDDRLSVRLSAETKAALEKAATADDRKPSAWAERAIVAALKVSGYLPK